MSHAIFFSLRESSNARPKTSPVGSESAPHFNMSLWSWVRALMEAKEKGMGHAPISCKWDHPSSEWARGWGPYKKGAFFVAPPPGPLRRGVVPLTGYRGMSHALFFRLRESSTQDQRNILKWGALSLPTELLAQLVVRVLPISICSFGLGFELSRRRKKRAWDMPL